MKTLTALIPSVGFRYVPTQGASPRCANCVIEEPNLRNSSSNFPPNSHSSHSIQTRSLLFGFFHVHLLSCPLPLQGLLLQHPSVLLISNLPTGSSVSQGVRSFAAIHHPELDPVCQPVVFHHPSTCSSSCSRYDCGFLSSHPSCQLLLSALFNLHLPFPLLLLLLLPCPWSPEHHISLQSRPK